MRTIREVVDKIDVNGSSTSELEVKCVSIKNYYADLKKQGRLRDMLRLRLIMYYYPNAVFDKISFNSLRLCIESPDLVTFNINDERTWMHPFEEYATKKSGKSRTFMLKYFYEYFKI